MWCRPTRNSDSVPGSWSLTIREREHYRAESCRTVLALEVGFIVPCPIEGTIKSGTSYQCQRRARRVSGFACSPSSDGLVVSPESAPRSDRSQFPRPSPDRVGSASGVDHRVTTSTTLGTPSGSLRTLLTRSPDAHRAAARDRAYTIEGLKSQKYRSSLPLRGTRVVLQLRR